MEVKDPIAGYATNPVVQILRHAVLRKVEKETSPVKLEKKDVCLSELSGKFLFHQRLSRNERMGQPVPPTKHGGGTGSQQHDGRGGLP